MQYLDEISKEAEKIGAVNLYLLIMVYLQDTILIITVLEHR